MKELQVFNHEKIGEVRALELNGEPWLVGEDVVKRLGYDLTGNSYTVFINKFVDGEDKIKVDKTQVQNILEFDYKQLGQRGGWIINESGLYSLVLGSRLPEAKKFRRWVTSEVLPSIRQNGGYIMNQEELNDDELLARALLVAQRTIEKRNQTIKQQEERLKLQQPKVEAYDDFISNDDTFGFRELVKYINEKIGKKITENQVREYLRKEKLYVKQGNKYVVSQECVRRGFGVLKDNLVNGINRPQSRFTFKLRDNLIEVFK